VEILSKLSSINDSPKKKFPMPMTSNQEIGWHNDVKTNEKSVLSFV